MLFFGDAFSFGLDVIEAHGTAVSPDRVRGDTDDHAGSKEDERSRDTAQPRNAHRKVKDGAEDTQDNVDAKAPPQLTLKLALGVHILKYVIWLLAHDKSPCWTGPPLSSLPQ